MNKKVSKGLYSLIALTLLIVTIALTLTSCFSGSTVVSEKEKIVEKMQSTLENDSLNYEYSVDYIYHWGIRNIDIQKISQLERVLDLYYNYEGGLPAKLEHARLTTEEFLKEHYDAIDLTDTAAVTDAILSCYAKVTNDPYSVYRPAEETDEYVTDLSGKFGGIGAIIEYNHQDKTLMVSSVYIDSPAHKAGLMAGDYFLAVDGKTVEELGYMNVVYHVRGEIGTEVKLTMKRGDQIMEFTAIRAEVVEKTVSYELGEDKIGYIQITDFKGNTYDQFVEAVDFMEANGAVGIVFDLRNNLGGYLSTVCHMLSYIVPTNQTIVSYQYKGRVESVIKSADDVHPTLMDENDPTKSKVFDHTVDLPMVVLCNEYTASSGEIFTSAIRDYRNNGILNAKVVGTLTYKKGVMQNTYDYADGSSITFTVAYYNPPCGVNYHGIGVTPDIEVHNTADEDVQLSTGYEELKKLINAN